MTVSNLLRYFCLLVVLACTLGGCSAYQVKKSAQVPPLSAIDNPTARPGYQPVQMPMPDAIPASYNPNSLWRNGSRAFFKDQRAHQIGDILTVKVTFIGEANIAGEMQRRRRTEPLLTNVAGVVTQVLPNGNLVIQGQQKSRVNFKVRELIVAGIVRPEDIESDNTIHSSKIAQARIAYDMNLPF